MNRKLIKQTLNDWRSNLWLALELLIVSIVVWYTVDYCCVTYVTYNEPLGFEVDHCYKINVCTLNSNSPDYTERDASQVITDKLEFIDRLSRRPEVEVASYSNVGHPYNWNSTGETVAYDTIVSEGMVNARNVSPEYFKVFKIRGANGETPEQLAALLENEGVFISSNVFENSGIDMRTHVHDTIHDPFGYNYSWEIKAVINPIRYSEYMAHGTMDKTIIRKINHSYESAAWLMDELCVRVKDNMDKDFIANLMADAPKHFRVGNLFIGSVSSFDNLRDNVVSEDRQKLLSMVSGMVFLLINVFLGLFGTFWFRTQQRVGEIAIRKVNGATRSDIFRRMIGEGLVILSVVTIPAICIDMLLAHFELNTAYGAADYFNIGRIIVSALITYALVALMIIAGIGIPAWRAMRLDPAVALHDE
jgi:putative ABC transport system permease protein